MNSADNLALLGRVMGGLIVVLVLVGLVARVARRAQGRTTTSGLRVIDRVGLSRDANLAVIEVSNRMLLLGVTAQGVTMLADLDDDAGRRDRPEVNRQAGDDERRTTAQPREPTGHSLDERLASPVDERFGPPERWVEMADGRYKPVGPRVSKAELPIALPDGVVLGDHPDLASALRAAGRTADAGPAATATPGDPATTPLTRAQARAQKRRRGWLPRQRTATGMPPPVRTARGTRSERTKRTVPRPGTQQASGSVLSPRTWRQGIEALRELTVRR